MGKGGGAGVRHLASTVTPQLVCEMNFNGRRKPPTRLQEAFYPISSLSRALKKKRGQELIQVCVRVCACVCVCVSRARTPP